MKDSNAIIAIFCHKTMNCSDHPIIVVVGKDGSIHDVIYDPKITTTRDLNTYKDFRYNGILTYTITVSIEEYHNRFEQLAKVQKGKGGNS